MGTFEASLVRKRHSESEIMLSSVARRFIEDHQRANQQLRDELAAEQAGQSISPKI